MARKKQVGIVTAVCFVCGRKSLYRIDSETEEIWLCGMDCYRIYVLKYGVPKHFRRGHNGHPVRC